MKGERKKILSLDDEVSFLDSLKRMLSDTIYDVDTASSVDMALSLMEEREYDIVLFDYQMPDKDGVAFVKEARYDRSKTKLILVTGNMSHNLADIVFKEGASGYLVKPFSEEALLSTLDYHINS